MGLTSLQVCMDSSDWLQGTMHEEESPAGGGMMDSSSSPSGAGGNIITCSRPMIERRLRPPHDQAQKCPRCESTHTKFCYYNNYSLSQPRYFCKTCRRYWTQGGTLRNIPVGGGCRKNTHKKHVSKIKSSSSNDHSPVISSTVLPSNNNNPTDFQLNALLGSHHSFLLNQNSIPNFLDGRYSDFTDTKQLEALRNYDFMGNNINGHDHTVMDQITSLAPSFQGLCSPFGIMGLQHGNDVNVHGTSGSGSTSFVDSCQRLMLPYDVVANHDDHHQNEAAMDVKPKLLALDQWQDQGCSDIGNRDAFAGYINGMGSWTGMINGYGSSASNPLV